MNTFRWDSDRYIDQQGRIRAWLVMGFDKEWYFIVAGGVDDKGGNSEGTRSYHYVDKASAIAGCEAWVK